jgi:hypothetical protein
MSPSQNKSLLLIPFLLLFCATLLMPQETEIDEIKKFITKKRINAAYFMFGSSQLGQKRINMFLEDREHPTIKDIHSSWGIGGHAIHNKFVLGMEIVRLTEREGNTDSQFNTFVSAKYTALNLGYLAFTKKGVMSWPFIGLGVGQLKLRITEDNIDSFNDFTGYQKGSESRRISFLFNAGIALDYFHKYNNRKKGKNSLVIGLRAGYVSCLGKLAWKVNGISVPDGPDSGITGPYVRIIIGLGGYIETLIKQAI